MGSFEAQDGPGETFGEAPEALSRLEVPESNFASSKGNIKQFVPRNGLPLGVLT